MIQLFKRKIKKDVVLFNEVQRINKDIKVDFGGGCSLEKALVMAYLIKEFRITVSVDIGVYRGRSLFPQAIAHKLFSNGKVYGVDPFSEDAAVQVDNPELKEALDSFLKGTDFDELFSNVKDKIARESIQSNCEIIRMRSDEAVHFFIENNIKIGVLHIDGNHDTEFVLNDAKNFIKLLTEKAFIVLDDISWRSVTPALNFLNDELVFIGKIVNKTNDFALFSKGFTGKEANFIKTIFKVVT